MGSQRLVDHLLTAEAGSMFTYGELAESCDMADASVRQAVRRRWPILETAGYRRSTLKAETGAGRGVCLVKALCDT